MGTHLKLVFALQLCVHIWWGAGVWLRCAQVELGDNDLVNTRAQNREDVPCTSTRQGWSCTCEDETVYSVWKV